MTVAVAKCNITGLALNMLNGLYYEGQCEDKSLAFVENYIESLHCPNVDLVICNPSDCKNETVKFTCLLNVPYLESDAGSSTTTVTLTANVAGGTPPFVYAWTFDPKYFTSGAINQDTLVLTVKAGFDISILTSKVTLNVTDANGCHDTKSCWIAEFGLKCNTNYVACINPSNLRVKNKVTYCVSPSNLRVTKKIPG